MVKHGNAKRCRWQAPSVKKIAAVDPRTPPTHLPDVATMAGRLKIAREARGLGCNALDRLAGLSVGTTSRYETRARGAAEGGSAAPSGTLSKLAAALGVREAWLIHGEEPMEADAPTAMPVLRNHPHWAELCAEAKRLRRHLTDADFERVADSPFLFGPLESVDAVLLADLTANVADWAARTTTGGGGRRF
jgi:hypothetical protein